MTIAFATIDWWIVGIYMALATLPGFLCRKYIREQSDFLLAGRTLSIWIATATLTATEMGLVTVMYFAQQSFERGLSAMLIGLIAGGTTLAVGLSGFMVKGLRESGVTTVAEYYQKRYTPGVRLLGGMIIATAGILNYGIFLKIEADFVRLITDMPETFSIPITGGEPIEVSAIKLVMFVLVALVLTYTLLGGMVSIALTDYVQFIVLSLGMGLTTYWVLTHPDVGGFSGIVEAVSRERPKFGMNPLVTEPLPYGGWLGYGVVWIVWQTMHWTSSNTWQTVAFRTASADSPRTVHAMWALTGINYFGRAIIPMLWGVAALAYFSHTGGLDQITESVQGMPKFLTHLPTGLVGFLLAGMLAAMMSTHSGYMLAWSGVLTEDLVAPIVKALTGVELVPRVRIWITRFFILCLGAFLLGWGLWFKPPGPIWDYLAITGTVYLSGSATLVAMGLYWKRANTRGAYLGILCGAIPGIIYLTLRIVTLIIEPAVRESGHAPEHMIAQWSAWFVDAYVGLASFPLAVLGMYFGSLWGEWAEKNNATGPMVGTGSFQAGGGA